MAGFVRKSRMGSNLQGALSTLEAIDGIVPLLHGIAGDGIQNFIANRKGNGRIGEWSGYALPSSNLYEKQIIFGGGSRLREQFKNLVRIIDGDLYIVLSGSESEMISDDVLSMTREITDQGYAASCCKLPGFRGDARSGYEEIVHVLLKWIENKISESEKEKDFVNLLGILPQQDLFWQGNLAEIERLLSGIGIRSNRLFGVEQTLKNWEDIPKASYNLVFSKWGLLAAEELKNFYGTPYLFFENIGIGNSIENVLKQIGDRLQIPAVRIDSFLEKERAKFFYACRQFSEVFFAFDFRRNISLVGEESKVIRYGEFLKNSLGMMIDCIVITDYKGEAQDQQISSELEKLSSVVTYSNDTEKIENILKEQGSDFVFGSSLEKKVVEAEKQIFYRIGTPQNEGLAIRDTDFGYEGAICIMEKLSRIGNRYITDW